MKKYLILVASLLLVIILVSCTPSEDTKIDNLYYKEAEVLLDKIYDDFWIEGANRFKSYHPEDTTPNSEYRGTAALWGYGAMMTAVSSGLRVNPKDQKLIDRAHQIVTELEQYRYPSIRYRYYTAIVGSSGEAYYDDNAWVVLALYEMAVALDNDEYMQISREVLDYVLSGESEDGGVYWKESVVSRNVAAIGPAIIGALLHYQNNPEPHLLETAIRLYDWTVEVLKDPSDHVYWDNAIKQENGTEKIEFTKWTYNSGTMIWSGLLLHEITGEEKYLTEASKTVVGSFGRFLTKDSQRNIEYFPSSPWFNVYLVRGYLEYARITEDTKYIDAFQKFTDLALERGKDANDYIYPSWGSGSILSEYKYVGILNQAAAVEILYLISSYDLQSEGQ